MEPTIFAYPNLGRIGRLGNQLWQVAATIARSRRTPGSQALIPPSWEYRPYLNVPEDLYGTPGLALRMGARHIDMATQRGGPYFQALEHLEGVAELLPTYFSPSGFGIERLYAHHAFFLEEMAEFDHYTAMHVRRTDYLNNPDRFPQLTRRYRRAAVELVLEKFGDTKVLVFSDDPAWCRENIYELGLEDVEHDFVEGHVRPIEVVDRTSEPNDIVDLFLMVRCQAHIIANSTFGWWGAYLGDQKLVIYPDRWYGADAQGYETMWNAIPREWVQLPC